MFSQLIKNAMTPDILGKDRINADCSVNIKGGKNRSRAAGLEKSTGTCTISSTATDRDSGQYKPSPESQHGYIFFKLG